jgi:hypothetical protein
LRLRWAAWSCRATIKVRERDNQAERVFRGLG